MNTNKLTQALLTAEQYLNHPVCDPPALTVKDIPCFEEYLSSEAKEFYKRPLPLMLEDCSLCGPSPSWTVFQKRLHDPLLRPLLDLFTTLTSKDQSAMTFASEYISSTLNMSVTDFMNHQITYKTKVLNPARVMAKVINVDEKITIPPTMVERFAKVFNLMVEHKMLTWGMVSKALYTELVKKDGVNQVLFLLVAGSTYSKDSLNSFLGNHMFIEGEPPTDDWTNLPT